MAIYRLGEHSPSIHPSVFIADQATVMGQVTLGEGVSVWPGVVIRGDNEPIVIGAGSNLQEGAVLHADPGFPLAVAANVTVGHQAMLHGCTVGAGSLIGIQAVLLNGAVIGRNCLVGAGALVTEGQVFADNSLIIGAPAKCIRELSAEAIERINRTAAKYVERAQYFKLNLQRLD